MTTTPLIVVVVSLGLRAHLVPVVPLVGFTIPVQSLLTMNAMRTRGQVIRIQIALVVLAIIVERVMLAKRIIRQTIIRLVILVVLLELQVPLVLEILVV